MTMPLTPEMSTSSYVPGNSLDAYDSCLSQTALSLSYNDAIFGLGTFGFDHNYNGRNNSLPFQAAGTQESSWPDQSFSHNQSSITPSSNNTLNLMDDNPFVNVLASSSPFQEPCGFGQLCLPENNTLNHSICFGEIPNLHDADCSTTDYIGCHNIPTLLPTHRHPSESSRSGQQSFGEINTSPYGTADLERQPYVPSQPQYHYDAFGNFVSPLRVMNEQYELQQLSQSAFLADGLDPAYLLPPPPLPNSSPLSFEKRASKSSTSKSNSHLVPPPPLPPAPPSQPGDPPVKVKRRRRRKPPPPPEVAAAKHKAFLQRNRQAASKCRTKKKAQIYDLEDEERMGRQINAVLKDEFKDILGEVIMLRKQVKEMPCEENCEGCVKHAPMRRDSVLASSCIGTGNIGTGSIEAEEEEKSED